MGESPHNPLAPYDGAIQETAKVGQRLIDVIKDYLEPWRLNRLGKEEAKRMKRQTSAIADGIVRIAEAESKGDEIKALAELKIREWNRQQQNRAAVVVEAKKYLPQSVPEESPDSDWINDFFRAVENISEQQLRTVFAKLLADEIGKPGTFSRRAISIAREMRAGDVSRLEEACSSYNQK